MDKQEIFTLTIEDAQDGSRMDILLSQLLKEVSRSYLQKLIENGSVTINGKKETSKKYKLKRGDQVEVLLPEPEALAVEAEDIPIPIVYEDDHVIVVNKDKGMVVHPAAGNMSGTLVNALLYHASNLSSINGVVRPGIVHRIDKDTTGLLMVAKNDTAHRSLARQLAEHSIVREYHAIVHNNFKEDEGTVNAPIGRDPKNRLKMAVTELNSKPAVTHYKVLERFGAFTHIKARLETGRTHQIRVHMSHIKHPLLGDMVYGPKKKTLGAGTQTLHAKVLGFHHPATGEYMEFDSPLPDYFEELLQKLRKESRS